MLARGFVHKIVRKARSLEVFNRVGIGLEVPYADTVSSQKCDFVMFWTLVYLID